MRTFYVFKITDEFANLTKDCPFNLYKSMEQIYFLNKKDFDLAYRMFETIAVAFSKKEINHIIFSDYRHNEFYTKFNNTHMLNNYYSDEQTELTVRNAHLVIKSNSNTPAFLNDLRKEKNLFICDFGNKDYFWLEQIQYS